MTTAPSRRFGWIPIATGFYSIAVGLATLLGWALDMPALALWGRPAIAMQPNTGVAAMFAGSALLAVVWNRRWWAAIAGSLVLALGAATLFQHATNVDLGIDRLLLFERTWGSLATMSPGRMGIPAATSWTLAGLGLLLLRRPGRTHGLVPALGLVIITIASLTLTGYFFGADTLYMLPRATAIAFQTATILFLVGLSLLSLAPDRAPTMLLEKESAAGALARRSLLVALTLPILAGYVCLQGQRAGWYDGAMESALLVLVLSTTLCTVLWWAVSAVNVREDSLRRSEQRFSRFMEHLPGLAWIKDEQGRYLYVNEAALKAFGRSRDEMNGKTDEDIFPAEVAIQFRTNDRQALAEGRGIQAIESLEHIDGVLHHSLVSKFPINAPSEQTTLIGGMAIDITDRRRAEDQVRTLLRISERLNSTLDVDELLNILTQEAIELVQAEAGVAGLMTPAGMVAKNYLQKGKLLPLDHCWPPMHGLPGWLIVHKKPYLTNDAGHDEQIVQELCRQFGVWSALSTPILSAQGQPLGFFEIHNRRDGRGFTPADREILVAVSQAAAIAIQNALAYRSLQDAEESLLAADQRKDEFLATLAHELRNPLAPIRTGLDILQHAEALDDASLKATQDAMQRQVLHLVRLVDDLLDISRITRDQLTLRKSPTDLGSVIQQAVETSKPVADAQNQTIHWRKTAESMLLNADPIRLTQVFSNLLNNACKYSPPGSSVHLAARRDGDQVVVSVRDNGIGIPADMLDRVFDMFTQVDRSLERSHGGLGIGLTLVKRLVELHGGSVTAASDGPGRGSEFVLRLPVLQQEVKAQIADLDKAGCSEARSCKVLLVDDNVDAAKTLGALIRFEGHSVALAHNGPDALQLAESFEPDVILLDIGLPGMNGYDVCRAIRARPGGNEKTIVALTGWGQEEDRRQSLAAGFDVHLVKPVDIQLVLQALGARKSLHAAAATTPAATA